MKLLRAVKLLYFTSKVLQSFSSLRHHTLMGQLHWTQAARVYQQTTKAKIVLEGVVPSISLKRLEFVLGFAFS